MRNCANKFDHGIGSSLLRHDREADLDEMCSSCCTYGDMSADVLQGGSFLTTHLRNTTRIA